MSTHRRMEIAQLDYEITREDEGDETSTLVARLRARIARRPGLWRKRMQTRHRRDAERLSPLPHAA